MIKLNSLPAYAGRHKIKKIMETALMEEKSVLVSDVKERVQDIYLAISWRELKRDYFNNGKSMSWFQHKIYGIDRNGGVGGFTPQ